MSTDFRDRYDEWLATNPRDDEAEILLYERAVEKVEYGYRKDLVQAVFSGLNIRRPGSLIIHEEFYPAEGFYLRAEEVDMAHHE